MSVTAQVNCDYSGCRARYYAKPGRPADLDRAADDGWTRFTSETTGLSYDRCPRHRPAHLRAGVAPTTEGER